MSLYRIIFLACSIQIISITAFPQPVPMDLPNKIIEPIEYDSTILRVRRYTDQKHNNFNLNNQPQRPNTDWELKGQAVRDKFGNIGGQLSLDRHGPNYDVSGQLKQNLEHNGRHGDRTWVGVNGNIRF